MSDRLTGKVQRLEANIAQLERSVEALTRITTDLRAGLQHNNAALKGLVGASDWSVILADLDAKTG